MPEKIRSLSQQVEEVEKKRIKKILSGFFVSVFMLICGFILVPKIIETLNVFASTSPWSQTNWSGGQSSSPVTETVTTYYSLSNIDPTTSPGNLVLEKASNWPDDFNNWSYRTKVTFDNTDSNIDTTTENLTDFPVLIKVSSGNGIDYDKTKDSGGDIRFSDPDGTVLSYEIDVWDETGTSYIWVKVPQIDQNSDTDYIYMYYGNDDAEDDQDSQDVWSQNFIGVWHLKDKTSTTVADSTTLNTDGTKYATNDPHEVSSKIGKAQQFDTVADYLNIPDTNFRGTYSQLSLAYWVKVPSYSGTYQTHIHRSNAASIGSSVWWAGMDNANKINVTFGAVNGAWSDGQTGITANLNEWYHIAGTWDGGVGRVYVNGQLVHTYNKSAVTNKSCSFTFGRMHPTLGSASYHTLSIIDDVQFSDIARSTAWIAASYHSQNDNFTTYSAEENKYPSSGTLTSNIFNAEFQSDWGVLTYNTSGNGTVKVRVRTDTNADMSTAEEWSESCENVNSSDISSNTCVTDTDQYLQYQITMEPNGSNTPIFEDISITFEASDQIAPSSNASDVAILNVPNGNWHNLEPVITWAEGEDDPDGNGLLGYCIALDEATIGNSSGLDPELSAGALAGLDDGVLAEYCPFIATGSSVDLSTISGLSLTDNKQYYFSIKAVDLSGNIWSGSVENYQDLASFKYDGTPPTNVSYISTPSGNFGSVNDMHFSWPSRSGSTSSDETSLVLGWQYSINGTDDWKGTETHPTLNIDYIPDDSNTYTHDLNEGDDGADIVIGNNTIYFRTVDNAGNASNYVSGGISYGGAAPSFGSEDVVTISPSSSTSNLFSLSWPEASANGGNTISTYYYMINRSPPTTLATLQSNSTQYIPTEETEVATGVLIGSVKGTNTIYVVAVDSEDNYSPTNKISGTYILNSDLPDAPRNLTVADSSIKSEEIWKASLTWDTPSYQGTGELTYIVQRSTDNSTWEDVGTTTGLSYTDTVGSSITYYYRVGSYDTTDDSKLSPTYTASVSIIPKGAYTSPPTLSSDPAVTNITTRKATISWSTSRTGDSKVQFGKKSGTYFEEEPSKPNQVTAHEIQLTNLSPSTKYYYRAKWTDEDGNTGTSDEQTFTTSLSPTITDPNVTSIGINQVTLNYIVENASKVKIYYGESTSFGGVTEIATATSETELSTTLTGLLDGTKYYYRINTFDSEEEEYEGSTLSFDTLPRPRISDVRIQQVRGTASPSVLVTWNANTDISSIVTYYPTFNPGGAQDIVNLERKSGAHKVILRGLLPQTQYSLVATGRDVAGNLAESDIQVFTTSTDTRPPLISNMKIEGTINLVSSGTSGAQAQLIVSWNTDEPATSQVEYGEGTGTTYSQKTQEDSKLSYNHTVIVSGLTPAKVYHLRAISKDEAGNETSSIDNVTITPKGAANALDLVVGNLQEAFGFIGDLGVR